MNGMSLQTPMHDPMGWLVVSIGTLATVWTIGASIYWTVRPGESDPQHPKRLILKGDR